MSKKNFSKRLYLLEVIVLIPLILFGLYKNGIRLYQKDLVGFVGMFKPLILLLIACSGALAGGIIRETDKKHKLSIETLNKCKVNVLEAILTVAILPLKTSPIIVFVVTFLFSAFLNKLKVNRIVLQYIAIEGVNVLIGSNTFLNAYEISTTLNYNGIDLFFGMGPGGIFATNVFLILLALIALSFNKLYKKEMVYAGLATFLALGIIPNMILENYSEIVPYIFGYNILFILVFVAPNMHSSCYTVKGQVLSGILISVITYGLSIFRPYTSAIVAVLIISLLKGVIDRIFVIK